MFDAMTKRLRLLTPLLALCLLTAAVLVSGCAQEPIRDVGAPASSASSGDQPLTVETGEPGDEDMDEAGDAMDEALDEAGDAMDEAAEAGPGDEALEMTTVSEPTAGSGAPGDDTRAADASPEP